MTTSEIHRELYYDPYDVDINRDPYPTYQALREHAPLYYNEQYDFYALSRYDDVDHAFADWSTFSSARGNIVELIQAGVQMPPGTFIFEDPPIHRMHRGLLSRVFTPRRMNALEPQLREFCAQSLDPLVGGDGFDFIADLGAQMPMRTISMLLGIPETDQEAVRDRADRGMRTKGGKPMKLSQESFADGVSGGIFAEYVDWRTEHPSDDLMTDLIEAEFEDGTGTTRRLTRGEILTFINIIAGAGNETTTKLIGWTGKVLAEHPDQRCELVEDRALIPNAIEELLRYESPAPHLGRHVTHDVEYYGQTVPEGSVLMLLSASANRDERHFANPDSFDIHRDIGKHLTFGYGIHFCLGAALARLEGRIALDEVLSRFPHWDVDLDAARLAPTSTVRGWNTLPVSVR
jgi:cytochrome P450